MPMFFGPAAGPPGQRPRPGDPVVRRGRFVGHRPPRQPMRDRAGQVPNRRDAFPEATGPQPVAGRVAAAQRGAGGFERQRPAIGRRLDGRRRCARPLLREADLTSLLRLVSGSSRFTGSALLLSRGGSIEPQAALARCRASSMRSRSSCHA